MFIILLFMISVNQIISLSVQKCTKNDNNISLSLTSGPVKGYCRFIENNAHQYEQHLHSGNVYTFLSIPYAEVPIGINRFKQPVEKQPWVNELDATKWPNTCIQEQDKTDDLFPGFKMWNTYSRTTNLSEDCLYLNIWLPLEAYVNSDIKQPILVFFHGASSALDIFDPSVFVASKSIIVITVNYRLGVFGSLYSDDLNLPGNQGLYDQIEALKWIKKNADSFGGNKERVTIAGHGSGAIIAGQHLFIKQSWDLFNNIILQSGTPLVKSLIPISKEEANRRAIQVFELAGCSNEENRLECVQNTENIFNASLDAFRQSIEGNLITELYLKTYFTIVIDNELVLNTPEQLLKQGNFKRCPILTGFTANEGSFLIAKSGLLGFKTAELKKQQNITHNDLANFLNEYFAYYPNYPLSISKMVLDLILHEYTKLTTSKDDLNLPLSLIKSNYFSDLSKILADQAFVCPAYKFSDALSKYGANVYLYLYSHRVSSSQWPIWYGAVTGDELAFTFGHTIANNKQKTTISYNPWANPKHLYTNNEKILTKEIIGYWSNFIKFNNPNSDWESVKWPQYTLYNKDDENVPFSQSGQYMVFKINGTKVSRGYSLEQCKFWNSYLPSLVDQHEQILKEHLSKTSTESNRICSDSSTTSSIDNIIFKTKEQTFEMNEEENLVSSSSSATKIAVNRLNPDSELLYNRSCSIYFQKYSILTLVLILVYLYF